MVARRRNDGNTTPDEVAHERWELIILAVQPVVLDRHVLAFDIAGLAQAFLERGQPVGGRLAPTSLGVRR
jgi:hypothetical protein